MSTVTEVPTTTRADVTAKICALKIANDWTWEQLASLTGQNPVWTAAALTGQCQLNPEQAVAVGEKFGLTDFEVKLLKLCPFRGCMDMSVPTDPFVYRFYEIMHSYGMAMKDVAQEEFGDGIMSAIDFSIDVDREPCPKGDRVKITFCGKFLPYKQF